MKTKFHFPYTFHINKGIGPIFINVIDLDLYLREDIAELVTTVSGSASLGPVVVSFSKIGLALQIEFGKPGVLGNADLDIGFKPPTGFGLSLDTEAVRGGGLVEIDPPNYATEKRQQPSPHQLMRLCEGDLM